MIMKIEDCAWQIVWNYTPPINYIRTQAEWEQTLYRKIKQISSQILKTTFLSKGSYVSIHSTLSVLIENLKLENEFKVIIDDNLDENLVFIYHADYLNLEGIVEVIVGEEEEEDTVVLLPLSAYSPEFIQSYLTRLVGCITINNFIKEY